MIVKRLLVLIAVLLLINCESIMPRILQRGAFSDPLCAIFDQQTGDCVACICRGYFDKNRVCRSVSDLCQTWNINTGECTSCYRGYELVNETCIAITFYNPTGNEDDIVIDNPNCQTDNGNGTCITCRPYYILRCGDCQWTGQNPYCAKFDVQNTCVQCDPGYELDFNNVCQIEGGMDNNTNSSCDIFPNCKECIETECTICQDGYRQQYQSRQCVLPSTNCSEGCATCSPNECFSCSQGYSAQSWPICIYCSYMYTRNSEGKCKAMQRDCSMYENCESCVIGECVYCKSGYTLNANLKCVASP